MAEIMTMDQYQYIVESFQVMYSDGTVNIDPGKVGDITIEHDYDDDYFPVIYVPLLVGTEDYQKMIDNKTTAKFRIKMIKQKINRTTGKTGSKKLVFNTLFNYYTPDDSPFLMKSLYEDAKKLNNDKTGSTGEMQECGFFIYPSDYLLKSKEVVNTVFSSINMNTAVAYVLGEAKYNNVLMQKSSNNENYTELILPPLTAQGALIYLQEYYGIYDTGMTLYHDINRMYVMAQSTKCNVYEMGEYTSTILQVLGPTTPESMQDGSYDDADKKCYYVNVKNTSITPENGALTEDLIGGNIVIATDPFTQVTTTLRASTKQIGSGTKRFMSGGAENGYSAKALQYELSENTNIVTITLNEFDIEAFTPNKSFSILYADKNVNKEKGGMYRLVKAAITFGDLISGAFVFKKTYTGN